MFIKFIPDLFQIAPKSVDNCPTTTVCGSGQIECASACYNSAKYCCISGYPAPASQCNTSNTNCATYMCDFALTNVREMSDGELRLYPSNGVYDLTFSLHGGMLKDNKGQTCTFGYTHQLECSQNPPSSSSIVGLSSFTQFGISNGFLVYSE